MMGLPTVSHSFLNMWHSATDGVLLIGANFYSWMGCRNVAKNFQNKIFTSFTVVLQKNRSYRKPLIVNDSPL